jgi:hypothetical protein
MLLERYVQSLKAFLELIELFLYILSAIYDTSFALGAVLVALVFVLEAIEAFPTSVRAVPKALLSCSRIYSSSCSLAYTGSV